MFFSLALLTIFLTLGCAKKQEPLSQPIVVQLNGGGDCVTNIGSRFSDFTEGRMSGHDVSVFWQCLGHAVDDYQNITSGENQSDRYTPQALRRFIQHYFHPGRDLSDSLLSGVMELKRVLLSGDTRYLTRAELTRMKEFLRRCEKLTLQVQPHARVLFGHEASATDHEVRAAAMALQDGLRELSDWLTSNDQAYSYAQLAQFLDALGPFVRDRKTLATFVKINAVLPPLKAVLLGGSRNGISGQEWGDLSALLGHMSYFYLASVYGFKQNISQAMTRLTFSEGLDQAARVLEQSARQHAQGEIPMGEWTALFAALEAVEWLPGQVKADALLSFWRWILRRPLGDGVKDPSGLSGAQIKALRERLGQWRFLLDADPGDNTPLAREFAGLLAASAPLSWDSEGRLIFADTVAPAWIATARAQMVWPYVLLRWLKDSYVGTQNYMTEDEMDTAVAEILPLLQNFGWLQKTKLTVGRRILREADLFTGASNGDDHLDLNEASRYLALVVASFRSAQVWLAAGNTLCPDHEAKCVRDLAYLPGFPGLDSTPRLKASLLRWPMGKFPLYMQQAEQTILGEVLQGSIGTGDFLEVWMLFSYVEGFIQRFDTDHSERINLSEATQSFALIGPTLGRLLSPSGLPPDELFAFFTFMMRFGDTPFTMFGGQIAFLNWKYHRDSWAFEAERDTLMSILNQLAKL